MSVTAQKPLAGNAAVDSRPVSECIPRAASPAVCGGSWLA